ncbi:sugar transferase [Halocatena halophila]|uniref:sugar transferase n=1 Tax=Halocatena halophila TaxID=2814576 RepID=UPI002ED59377
MSDNRLDGVAAGWHYRLLSIGGTAVLSALTVVVMGHPAIVSVADTIPMLARLPHPPEFHNHLLIVGTAVGLILLALGPLFKPQPLRVIDVVAETQRRVLLAGFGLATIGYFDYSFRMSRMTLVLSMIGLLIILPSWFILIRNQKRKAGNRAIIVGNDQETIDAIVEQATIQFIGFVSLNQPYAISNKTVESTTDTAVPYTDGGVQLEAAESHDQLEYLGGISRLSDIIVEHNPDTIVLAFSHADREEFFGVLNTCYRHGVTAKVHPELGNDVLTRQSPTTGILEDIDLEPWDLQDRLLKRGFDILFATIGLVFAAPVMFAIAIAIKLDSPGSIIYAQERTATFGGTFTVYKFRSMIENAEAETGAVISEEDAGGIDPRVTRVGQFLRRTHLDELPQLWSIFTGHMSVVGPRPERPEIDREITADVTEWKQRWFVKPGLTGLAQIEDVTGHDPDQKLRFDTEYIRSQSIWLDIRIVIIQVYKVMNDAFEHGE